jgi:undecaprenyl-diphosphatase
MDMAAFPTFLMITNTGSFLALLLFFRKDVEQLIKGTFCYLVKKDETGKEDFIYVLKLIVAIIPVGLVGLLIKDYLPDDLLSVGFALVITSLLLFYVYKQRDIQWKNDVTWRNAFVIGAFQMFAIFPGISRSGITISGGLTQKIELKKVLKFSFLSYLVISVPVSLLGIYEAFQSNESIHYIGYSLAFVMSFVFSLIAVRFLYNYVKVKNLVYFSMYCLIVGIAAIIMYFI